MSIKKTSTHEELLAFVIETLEKQKTTGKGSRARLGAKLVTLGNAVLAKFPPQTR